MKKKLLLPFLTLTLAFSSYANGEIDCNDPRNLRTNACGGNQITHLQNEFKRECISNPGCEPEGDVFYVINNKRYMVGAVPTDSESHGLEDDSYTVALYITADDGKGTAHDHTTTPYTSIGNAVDFEKTRVSKESIDDKKTDGNGGDNKVSGGNKVTGNEGNDGGNSNQGKKPTDLLEIFTAVADAGEIDTESPVKYKKGTTSFKLCQRAMAAADADFETLATASSLDSHSDTFESMTYSFAQYYNNKKSKKSTKIDFGVYETPEGGLTVEAKASLKKRAQDEKRLLEGIMAKAISMTRTCVMLVKVTKENFSGDNNRHKDTEYLKPEVVKSFDQRLKCQSFGLETIDYDECRSMIYAYNGAKVVIDGNEALQVFQGQEAANEANMKLMDMQPNEDVSTKALEVQRDGIVKQKEMAEVRAGLQTAKLAAMWGFAAKLPSDEDVINLCKDGGDMEEIISTIASDNSNALGSSSSKLHDFDRDSETQCLASYQNDDHGLLANTGQKPTAVAIAAEAGIDMAKEMMAVDMLGRQENMVDGVINKVKGMDTIDLPEDAFQNPELVTFCQANPNAQECVGFGTGMTTHVNSGGLSFTGGLAANETLNPTTDSDDNATAITQGTADRDGTNSLPTSRAIASVDKGGGFEGSTPGKAKVSSSPVGSGGGAGGGGAPGGGGLSGSGPSTGGKGVAPSSNSRKYKLGYSGGSRPLSFRGGSKRSKRSSGKGIGNPFAKMMKKKGKSTDVFNFRGLASKGIGSKDGDLFKRISNSYNTVNKKNRLIKYKIAE